MRTNAANNQNAAAFSDDAHFIQPRRGAAALYLADERIRKMQRNEIHRDGYGRHPAVDTMLHVHARARASSIATAFPVAPSTTAIPRRLSASVAGFARALRVLRKHESR